MSTDIGKLFLILAVAMSFGCSNDSSFSGESAQDRPERRVEPRSLETSDDTNTRVDDDDEPELVNVDNSEDEDIIEKSDSPSDPPKDAVTAGSFTAWTEPADPVPGNDYRIIIEVKLPSNVSNYSKQDLSGMVIGTDGYRQGLGRDSGIIQSLFTDSLIENPFFPGFKTGESFNVFNNRARLSVSVPGAAALVEDRINITSDELNESQSLVIQF